MVDSMKILVKHNFHRKGSASGDDQVFKSETNLLEKNGNTVLRYTVSNDSFDNAGIWGKLKATLGMLWSTENYRNVKRLIEKEKPQIVHIHTFFLFSFTFYIYYNIFFYKNQLIFIILPIYNFIFAFILILK